MARVRPLTDADIPEGSRPEVERQRAASGRVTNMKRTLAHSPTALNALMQWYALHQEVLPILGQRLTTLYAHAISSQTDCLICSTFFRRLIKDSGDNPDQLTLDVKEQAVVDYGRQLARNANGVTDALFERLAAHFTDAQLVSLTAFGGLMIATNVFNNALAVDLDDYLQPYRKQS